MDCSETREVELMRIRLNAIRIENTHLEQELECLTRSESAQENEEREEADQRQSIDRQSKTTALAQLSVMEELAQLKAAKEETEIGLKAIVADNLHIKLALQGLMARLDIAPKKDDPAKLPAQPEHNIDRETPQSHTIEGTLVFDDGPNSWHECDTRRRIRSLLGDADAAMQQAQKEEGTMTVLFKELSEMTKPQRTSTRIIREPSKTIKNEHIFSATEMLLHGKRRLHRVDVSVDSDSFFIGTSRFASDSIFIKTCDTTLFHGNPSERCCVAIASAKGTILLQTQSQAQRLRFVASFRNTPVN